MSQLAEAYLTIKADSGVLPGQLANVRSMFSGAVNSISSSIAVAGGVFNKLVEGAQKFISQIQDAEVASVRFNIAVQASGRGGYFKGLIDEFAAATSATTQFGAGATRAAAAAIAKYSTLSDDIMPEILRVSQDIAAQTGSDMISVASSLAMALERPEVGMRRLRAVGVNLTAEQQQQIQTMLKLGDASGAQATLLQIAASKYPGAAAAIGNTLYGLTQQIQNAFKGMSKAIGEGMLPTLKAVAKPLLDLMSWIKHLVADTSSVVGAWMRQTAVALGMVAAIGMLTKTLGVLKALLFSSMGPIGWLVSGLAFLAARFLDVNDVVRWFTSTWTKVTDLASKSQVWTNLSIAIDMLTDRLMALLNKFTGGGPDWGQTFSGLGDWIAWGIDKLGEFLGKFVDFLTGLVDNAKVYWEQIKIVVKTVWIEAIDYLENAFIPAAAGVFASFVAIVRKAMQDAAAWFKVGVYNMITGIDPKMLILIGTVMGGPFGAGVGGGMALGIRDIKKPPTPTSTIEEYQKAANTAFESAHEKAKEAAAQGTAARKKEQDDLAERQRKINDQIAWDEFNRWQESEGRRRGQKKEGEEASAQAYWDLMDQLEMDNEPYMGGGGGKAAKEKQPPTGFVGVAEFAKQFQAAVLKDADKYAQQTANNTGITNEKLGELKESMDDFNGFAE